MSTQITQQLYNTFKDLTFDEGSHTYTLDNNKLKSTSGHIKSFYKPFDAKANAERLGLKNNLPPQHYIDEWEKISKQASSKGHSVHEFGESWSRGILLKPQTEQELGVIEFWMDNLTTLKVVATELRMFHPTFAGGIGGTADIIFLNEVTGNLVVGDYKTNKDLYKNFAGQRMGFPFNDMLDSPYSHYCLQFGFYKLLLEMQGYKVDYGFLIWLQPDLILNKKYQRVDLIDTSKVLKNYYANSR